MRLMEHDRNALFLDLGCDDGFVTVKLAQAVGTKSIYGIDINSSKLVEAEWGQVFSRGHQQRTAF